MTVKKVRGKKGKWDYTRKCYYWYDKDGKPIKHLTEKNLDVKGRKKFK